ncbi:MAG TPA: hypothetical protein PK239_10225 [Chitinophagales bacterium]|nr:hypothetical protein [Chitinophagales bacterium]
MEAILRDFFTASAVTTTCLSEPRGANMKDKPFDLVMATLQDADSGEMVFTRPHFIGV